VVFITIVFMILTFWTWRKWPDLLRDFGREIYIPWQINVGKVLYKDIAYRHGPLAPYLNAIWFRFFGVSLNTLIYCNLSIIITIVSLIFVQIKDICDRTTSVMACIVFLCTAAFRQFNEMGSFDFVCPYDHSATHGIVLSFFMIYCLSSYLRKPKKLMLVLAGLTCGLVFLTKVEIFAPLAVTGIVGMMFINYKSKLGIRNVYKIFLLFVVSMTVPLTLFLFYFSSKMPFSQALQGVLGDWVFIFKTHITNIYFFKKGMGTDQPIYNIARAIFSLIILFIIMCVGLIQERVGHKTRMAIVWSFFFLGLYCTLGYLFYKNIILNIILILFDIIYRPLFLTTLLLLLLIGYLIYMKKEYIKHENMAPFILLTIFGMLTLGKMILNCRIEGYGFILPMPAMLVNVILFVWFVPIILRNEYGNGETFRKLAILWFSLISICALIISNYYYSKKDYVIGKGNDYFLSYGPEYATDGLAVNMAIKRIKETTSSDDNFTPIPEGLIINYLMRRPSPFRYDDITPGELTSYGESAILDSLKNSHPKFILLIHRSSMEFGVGFFGSDPRNGKRIMDWIKSQYTCVWQLLNEPLKDNNFGIEMLQRVN